MPLARDLRAVSSSRNEPTDLDALLSNTGDGVCAIGAEGKIVLWNRSAERILGYSAREVIGKPCCEVLVGRDPAGNRLCYQGCHVMALVSRGEQVQHFDMATRTKSGKPVWLNISILVVPGSRREVSTTVHFFRDVTVSRAVETLVRERLTRATAEAEPDPGAAARLTRRELEILRLMASGANTRTMAERLHVSSATVRNHVQNILGKLGVHSRLEAAAYATRRGLIHML
jgi:PAS domain S-box-containing protein